MGEGQKGASHFSVKGPVFWTTAVPHAMSRGEGEDRVLAAPHSDELLRAHCVDD